MAIVLIFIVLMAAAIALAAISVPLLGLAIVLMCVSFGLLFTVFWIWMLVDCIKNENIGGNERVVWVVVIALTHWVGALIYFFAARTRQKSLPSPPPLARAC